MNKKYLIIGAIIIVIILLVIGIASLMMKETSAYENYTFNDTGTTIEVPIGTKVRQDMNVAGITSTILSTPDGRVLIQREIGDNPYIDDSLEGASDMLNSYDGDTVNGVTLQSCSRTAKNEATGEVILVTSNNGDNATVEYIINSIKWGNNTNTSTDNTSSVADSSSSEKTYTFNGQGSYHIGDVVDDHDVLYQLQSNGQWVRIGEATGSEQHGYSQGYSQAVDDMSDDYEYYEDDIETSGTFGGSSEVETTSDE